MISIPTGKGGELFQNQPKSGRSTILDGDLQRDLVGRGFGDFDATVGAAALRERDEAVLLQELEVSLDILYISPDHLR